MTYLLLTGATGLVGRYVLRNLILTGVPVAAMVRPGKGEATLDGIMGYWEDEIGRALPRPVVIQGDLCLPQIVPDDSQRRWLAAHCDQILSCAASMTFVADKHGEPYRTNVEGTRHLLELCQAVGIRRFHQVSTAYICGLRQGRILESEIDVGQELGNVYERSKLQAEKLIRGADFLEERTFYRPASVVGDSVTGYVSNFHGFYLPLQLAHAIASRVPVAQMNERFFAKLGLRGDEGKNLVPVDWLAAAIAYLVTHPEFHGQTYHLASPKPVPVVELQRVIQVAIECYYPKTLATTISDDDLKIFEGMFYDYMLVYQSHWRDDPKFDLTHSLAALPHLPCPEMNYDVMLRMAKYPVERNFNPPRHAAREPRMDVDALLTPLAGAGNSAVLGQVSGQTVALQVNGPGGGGWKLHLDGERFIRAERGLPDSASPGFYLSAATLRQLAVGALSIDASINDGRLVVQGPHERLSELIFAFEQLVSTDVNAPLETQGMR